MVMLCVTTIWSQEESRQCHTYRQYEGCGAARVRLCECVCVCVRVYVSVREGERGDGTADNPQSLCLSLVVSGNIATCPNCREDGRIKQSKFRGNCRCQK